MRDVGDPLKGPFLRLDDFRSDVGDLRDVAHGWRDSLSVEVSSDRRGKGGIGYKVGAFNVFVKRFFP